MSVYVVRPGDNLFRIALRHGTNLDEVARLNPHIEDLDLIFPGMAVNLPGEQPVMRENPVGGEIPWFQIAREELALGVAEVRGAIDNPRIIEYHATCSLRATNDETAWCSSFVNWCVIQAGFRGTNSAAARSWLQWDGGQVVQAPTLGCITVLSRGRPWQGHVGFHVSETESRVTLLGGNQGNAVSQASFAKNRVLAYIVPKT